MNKKALIFFSSLLIATVIIFFWSLASGPHALEFSAVLNHLGQWLSGTHSNASAGDIYVVTELRLPRTILAFLVGAALALSGAVVQTLFRNPLADPSLIGVSSGAALAAAAALVLGGTWALSYNAALTQYLLPVSAFIGGLIATWLIVKISRTHYATSLSIVLLTGIAINALAGSGIGLLSYVATDTMLRSITFWTLGSLAQANWTSVVLAVIFMGIVLVTMPFYTRAFNALLLGEAAAQHLGIAVEKVKRGALFGVALSVGAAVALTGIIGFIGLVIPHMVRLVLGSNHKYVLPGSILLGGNILMLADISARTWLAPAELPIGIITALLGAPFFLLLIIREKHF
jgi:iron complex transport system permease protein